MTTSWPPPGTPPAPYQSLSTANAAAASSQTTTPLPAASPSAFTTAPPCQFPSARVACASVCTATNLAVGIPWRSRKRFAKTLLVSSRPPPRLGPKTNSPASRQASPTPAAIAVSGPSTTRSIAASSARRAIPRASVGASSGQFVPREAVPALPGACTSASHEADAASRQDSASSRAPPPTIRIRIGWVERSCDAVPPSRARLRRAGLRARRRSDHRQDDGTTPARGRGPHDPVERRPPCPAHVHRRRRQLSAAQRPAGALPGHHLLGRCPGRHVHDDGRRPREDTPARPGRLQRDARLQLQPLTVALKDEVLRAEGLQEVRRVEQLTRRENATVRTCAVENALGSLDDERCGDRIDVAASCAGAARRRPSAHRRVHQEGLLRAPTLVGSARRRRGRIVEIAQRRQVDIGMKVDDS